MLQMRLHNITMNSMKNRYTFLEDNIYLKYSLKMYLVYLNCKK